ncbi:inner-membrane translocator [Siminovitchia acidinfaciens]|uniref:Inner-membrane translocator n=1 Tax=Siminovitchia acidinfaciens TaxID=2321395 RepID=A0A429Y7L7_9BACI|nr:inner-membrane translocator [Siminovitchia acidinfaciens]RST77304.1 inner-membrane translocator [Siminovitchia acidinfaciens]
MIVNEQAQKVYLEKDKFILENNIKPLVTEELIEEHRRTPVGKHSAHLLKVLNYLRRHHEEIEGKYLIINLEPHKKWCLGRHPGGRGVQYEVFDDETFDSREAAEHALFLRRLRKFGLVDENHNALGGNA